MQFFYGSGTRCLVSALAMLAGLSSPQAKTLKSLAEAQNEAGADFNFAWTLPRTVLDLSVVYTFVKCDGGEPEIQTKATIIDRAIPDSSLHPKHLSGGEDIREKLHKWTKDTTVTVKTYPGSNILQSIGAKSADQTATIANNILTGAGTALKLSSGFLFTADGGSSKVECGSAADTKNAIVTLQRKISEEQQKIIDKDPSEAERELAIKKIELYQKVLDNLSSKAVGHSITLQATIDPGFTHVDVRDSVLDPSKAPTPVAETGIVASVAPTRDEVFKAGWIKGQGIPKALLDSLQVHVYLNFEKALPLYSASGNEKRQHTKIKMGDGVAYREVAYIPVHVYQGKPIASLPDVREGSENETQDPSDSRLVRAHKDKVKDDKGKEIEKDRKPLVRPQRIAFAQYGRPVILEFTAELFQNKEWTIGFQPNGEITDGTYSSRSPLVTASGAFSTLLSTANTIATERRTSETTRLQEENAELQARIVNFDLQQKLQTIEAKQGR